MTDADRLILLLETQQLDEISIPIPAGIQNLINKAVDARARYNRDAAAREHAKTEKAELNRSVRIVFNKIIGDMEKQIGSDRKSMTLQTMTYNFLYRKLIQWCGYENLKANDKIFVKVLKNPIASKLAAIDHFTPISLAILKSNNVISQDPQFRKFRKNPRQIDAAIADLIEALITLTLVELDGMEHGEDLPITDTVVLNNTSYAKESDGSWYDEATGKSVVDKRLLAILNKAHGLKNTNFATHTVNYEGVNYTKDPKTGVWTSAPQNIPVEKSQSQLIDLLNDLLAHKTGTEATRSVNDNLPR